MTETRAQSIDRIMASVGQVLDASATQEGLIRRMLAVAYEEGRFEGIASAIKTAVAK